jgi:hypothetical protein
MLCRPQTTASLKLGILPQDGHCLSRTFPLLDQLSLKCTYMLVEPLLNHAAVLPVQHLARVRHMD